MLTGQLSPCTKKPAVKVHSDSHCCLDYAKVYDGVRRRIDDMTQKLKNELNIKNAVQQYICTDCERCYSALDALQLASPIDDLFHCEKCNKNLVVVGGDCAERHEQCIDMLRKMEEELRPLSSLLHKLKGVATPELITLQEWRTTIFENANAAATAPISLTEGTNIETSIVPVAIHHETLKDLPEWIIKGEGSNLTQQQKEFLSSQLNGNRQVGMKSKRDHDL